MTLAVFMYSHSDYSDVWTPFLSRFDTHCDLKAEKFLFTDIDTEFFGWKSITYDPSQSYCKRLLHCLEKLSKEITSVLYLHEDMILYDAVDTSLLKSYVSYVEEGKATYIKLLKGGIGLSDIPNSDIPTLKKIYPHNWNFSIQPSVWNRKDLELILKTYGKNDPSIWELETNAQKMVNDFPHMQGYYHFNNELKRGQYHWNSSVFPFIATAIVKGKWNYSEYPEELMEIFNEFNIDKNERGLG